MKGIMVPLVTIWMTGMVMGQQPQNNTNQFGNPYPNTAPSRSVLDANSNNSSRSTAAPSQVQQLGPMDLRLTDSLIRDFKQHGQLVAEVEPREVVNEIVLLYDRKDSTSITAGRILPRAKQGSVLVFEINDDDLQVIQERGLKYTFDSFERGNYKTVQLIYRPSVSPHGNPNDLGHHNSAGQTYLPSPAPDYTQYDRNFMGPLPPNVSFYYPNQSNPNPSNQLANNGSTNWSPSSNTGNQISNTQFGSSNQLPANPSNSQPTMQTNSTWGQQSANPFQDPTQLQFQQQQPYSGSNSQYATGQTNPLNGGSTNLQPITNNNALTQAQLDQQELARRKADAQQQQIDLEKQELFEIERLNQIKRQAYLDRQQQRTREELLADMARRNPNYNSSANDYGSNQFGSPNQLQDRYAALNGFVPGGTSPTGSNYGDQLVNGYGSPPSRNQNEPTPQVSNGVGGLAASINGPNGLQNPTGQVGTRVASNQVNSLNQSSVLGEANKLNEDRAQGLIYFMLLFSLGLNVYLGWISRGFYVRYNELADELRETFTATM